MPVFPNLRRTVPRGPFAAAPATPLTFVDAPTMDYVAWLGASGGSIAGFDGDPSARSVAVVGSGGAGLAAAYELLRCGLDVTVFEATDRIGGRLFSSPAATRDGNVFEMGAMRFTPSERVLHHYADVFTRSGASTITFDTGAFPDPGENLTYVAFQGRTYVWDPESPGELPPSAEVTRNGWNAFVACGFASADGSIRLEAPQRITEWLATDPQGRADDVRQAWSAYIRAFGDSSLYEAVVRIFGDAHAPGGTVWRQIDFEFFGALGTGFGGFGPLFPICFLDIMRFVINAVDSDQHEITTGVESIVRGFLNQEITLPGGRTTTLARHVVTHRPVKAVVPAGPAVTLAFEDGTAQSFDRVIVATSHRSMELTMGLGTSVGGRPLAENVADAVRRLHLENSSKVFAETGKFWNRDTWPRNVVGDTILRNLYTLDYPDAPAERGVLLFSYTWADDSVKQQTFTQPADRMELLFRDLAGISEELAAVVRSSVDPRTAQLVDWQSVPYYFGAFKLNHPGEDVYVQAMFYDFLKAGGKSDTGVYIAGDSVGFLGGWVENAFQTGLNAAAAVAVSLGGRLTAPAQSPFARLRADQHEYGVAAGADAHGAAAD
ncbi:MAG TPA: NAD(P)/FAD-dependent oxidoreductase [Longimicrobiaceae bacterium]|nr:NAD(P)/FAD-dependent oxidoreductase [Longimicrobiaceae bacterium]